MTSKIIPVQSGQFYIGREGEMIETTLGSCIAFCIFDKEKKIGGMLHFLLPYPDFAPEGSSVSRNSLNFGSTGIRTLLKEFKVLGSQRENLEVSLFGAGISDQKNFQQAQQVAQSNLKCALDIVHQFGLKLSQKRVLEKGALSLRFHSNTGQVDFKEGFVDKKNNKSIKVLIVDDSPSIQRILTSTLAKFDVLKIVGTASDAFEAEEMRKRLQPDVMTLDIHMPNKDGVTYLGEIMERNPMPVIMVSDLSHKEAGPVMKALEIGAFDYVKKPALAEIQEMGEKLKDLIVAASLSVVSVKKNTKTNSTLSAGVLGCDLLCIGSSTGGTEALRVLFKALPKKSPPILIVQHMPGAFTNAFAASLDRIGSVRVKEAQNGEVLASNTAYVAPGGFQMKLIQTADGPLKLVITDDPPVNRFKPSVDYLFHSVSKLSIVKKTYGVLLTGMGDDGARGLLELKNAGAFTVAQSERTCVVYGMPKAAIERRAATEVVDLEDIVTRLCSRSEIKRKVA